MENKFNLKSFIIGGFVMFAIFVIIGVLLRHQYLNKQAEEKAIQDKYEADHASIVRDSLMQIEIARAEFNKMKNEVSEYDSAKSTMRYKIGEIVYLKPDSLRAVVNDITIDYRRLAHTYMLIISNVSGQPTMLERKEELIY